MNEVKVWTDGSCSPNPGTGGWAWVTEKGKASQGIENPSTNQRMEMRAVLEALKEMQSPGIKIKIHTDSKFVIDGCTKWRHSWKTNGWKRPKDQEIKNLDLWLELDEALQFSVVEFVWVKGHSGDTMNDLADSLATAAVLKWKA